MKAPRRELDAMLHTEGQGSRGSFSYDTQEAWRKQTQGAFAGYHQFHDPGCCQQSDVGGECVMPDNCTCSGGQPFGSFEVFHVGPNEVQHSAGPTEIGWYWWPCFPGCLPDGDPSGPFPTAEGAYLDAIGE